MKKILRVILQVFGVIWFATSLLFWGSLIGSAKTLEIDPVIAIVLSLIILPVGAVGLLPIILPLRKKRKPRLKQHTYQHAQQHTRPPNTDTKPPNTDTGKTNTDTGKTNTTATPQLTCMDQIQINDTLRILNDCVEILMRSKNPSTIKGRIELGIEKANFLKKFERAGLYKGAKSAQEYLTFFNDPRSVMLEFEFPEQPDPPSVQVEVLTPAEGSHLIKFGDKIPADILRLLWFENGPYANFESTKRHASFEYGGRYYDVSFQSDLSVEPSLIDCDLPIADYSNNSYIGALGYYPSYRKMTPEQRGKYLNWLRNITDSIDIGYVFVFYYGLERHILFGQRELALQTIFTLRKHHDNNSFLSYSNDAVMLALLSHGHADCLTSELLGTLNLRAQILFSALLEKAFSPQLITTAYKSFNFTNKRYISSNLDLFISTMEMLMMQKYGEPCFRVLSEDLKQISRSYALMLANYSLLPRERGVIIPDITTSTRIQSELHKLLNETHEAVKAKLRELRKTTPN